MGFVFWTKDVYPLNQEKKGERPRKIFRQEKTDA
jgi:hypothetical protein